MPSSWVIRRAGGREKYSTRRTGPRAGRFRTGGSASGVVSSWQLQLGSFAVKGAALVVIEALAVEARGKVSPHDAGIWNDKQADALLKPLLEFVKSNEARCTALVLLRLDRVARESSRTAM
ncbi:hypothetical protein JCM5296_001630 [Sporobolomyces johnsonii]